MRTFLITAALLLMINPIAPHASSISSQPPQTFKSFWSKFKSAVARNDKQAIASMTRLPFPYDNRELDKAEYIKLLGQKIFTRRDRRCFARAKPVRDRDYYAVFCGEEIFSFTRVNGEWKFMEISPND